MTGGHMVRDGFDDHLRERGIDPSSIGPMMGSVADFEEFLGSRGRSIDDCDVQLLNEYLSLLIGEGSNQVERLVTIARYCAFSDRPELFIHLATILNSYDILPLMEKRVKELIGNDCREAVFYDWKRPPLGTSPEEYTSWTSRIIDRMENELTPKQCRAVLTWNYHEIPKEAFSGKKKRFEAANRIDDFLAEEHHSLVEELSGCLRSRKIWYEQEVTQEFVDHVASDQRVQTGVRQDDRIICEKVPFDPKRFYPETDPQLRRYHYCHCPLVRSSIKNGGPKVPSTFCYCSAGFTKTVWDVIFDEPVEVEILQSVLRGDDRCVFSIKIPDAKIK